MSLRVWVSAVDVMSNLLESLQLECKALLEIRFNQLFVKDGFVIRVILDEWPTFEDKILTKGYLPE